jgi:hypothetical protein
LDAPQPKQWLVSLGSSLSVVDTKFLFPKTTENQDEIKRAA